MSVFTRTHLSDLIYDRILSQKDTLTAQYRSSDSGIGYFYLDNVLPEDIATTIYTSFPSTEETVLKKSIRQFKHVAAQMDKYNPVLEEIIFAFQDQRIVRIIGEIANITNPLPDDNLYAGGISMMSKGNYLNPHLDNSHDKDRNQWRVLNLLYYVTPDWEESYGGNLEIWPNGLEKDQITIHSKFNRLAIMATHNTSWHSVSPVSYDGTRCCISNYYFSETALRDSDHFHVTSFRGRPGQYVIDKILQVDSKIRMGLRKVFKKGIRENPHVYKK
ncbi:MAG: Rps23 Pro-64 3,4-dihydroxylase Tpa1-like proline 4-hydroxylase [Dokdonia sp.]|jgi:Rps23 Pro-64 3,4-dihydroxylase Tpa1-like proline 4-hydroxylase